jgi:toxin-antitoxin system PIN domain toxin
MSFALDVNILLYASDTSSPLHAEAKAFLEDCVAKQEVFCVAWTTLISYLRIATHPSVFVLPLTPKQAMGNVRALLSVPHLRVLSEEQGFWQVYESVAGAFPVRGNLVPDAHLAALLRQHGVRTLFTNDIDFRRFKFLELRSPFG